MTLKNFICETFEHTSGIARMLIDDGSVRLNGVKVPADADVLDGDVVLYHELRGRVHKRRNRFIAESF
jgi:ribosomal 50S subunit-recycling heat shock protein